MSGGFVVQPARLRESGAEMADVGRGLDDHGGRLVGEAGIWGSNEEGAAFGTAYTELVDATRGALAALVAEFVSIGDRLVAMADTYTDADTVEGVRMRRIAGMEAL